MSAVYKQAQKCASLASCTIIAKISTEIIHFFDVFIEYDDDQQRLHREWYVFFFFFWFCCVLLHTANTIWMAQFFFPPKQARFVGIEITIIAKLSVSGILKRKSNQKKNKKYESHAFTVENGPIFGRIFDWHSTGGVVWQRHDQTVAAVCTNYGPYDALWLGNLLSDYVISSHILTKMHLIYWRRSDHELSLR